jgi:hypothetical protein
MANQVTVSNDHSISVTIEPPANVQVLISRAVIGTVANVPTANFANFAGNVTASNQPNITTIGTLSNLTVTNTITTNNLVVTGNLQVGNLIANSANFANFAGIANSANSVTLANVVGIGNIASINLDGNVSNLLTGAGTFVAIPSISNVANANYANFAGNAFSVSGANVSGTVANATYATSAGSANTAATVTTNAQPNITSVGTLTGLVVSGNITPNANITYDLGNNTNRFKDLYLAGNSIILGAQTISANATGINVTGNLSGDASGLSNIAGANVTGTVANANYSAYSGVANSANSVAGANVSGVVANANYSAYSGIAGSANSVAGANVSGAVSFATAANSVAVANVSGIGNIATVNLDGNVSNLLTGSGTFVAIPTVSSNANYANFAGQVVDATQSNITTVGTLTTLTVSGDTVITGNLVVNGNTTSVDSNTIYIQDPVIQIGGGANGAPLTINDGRDRGTVLDYFDTAPISAFMGWKNANGRFEFASNVTLANNVVTVNQLGNVSADYYIGNGSQLTGIIAETGNANYANFSGEAFSVSGSNVSGEVANANYANFAGDVVNSSQPNITDVGILTGIYTSGILEFVGNSNAEIQQDFSNGATTITIYGGNHSSLLRLDGLADARVEANANVIIKSNSQVFAASEWNFDNTGNLTLPSNTFAINYANGTQVSIDNVANANYANFAGQVVDATQSNITAVGNLVYLNVRDDSNTSSVIRQFTPNSLTINTQTLPTVSFDTTNIYWPNASTGMPSRFAIRNRGNSTTPTTAVSGDRIINDRFMVYNGNTNVLAGSETWTLTAGGTLDNNANQAIAGGQWNILTGNPAGGNLANANALATQNQLIFTNSGSFQINPGAVANSSLGQASTPLLITNYGLTSTDLVGAGGVNQQKARGNRDGLLSVQPGDTVGRQNFWGYNGTIYQSSRPASMYAVVDSAYVANATVIPLNMIIRTVNSSNVSVDTTFYGNGLTNFPGNITTTGNVSANFYIGNGSSLTSITGANVTGQVGYAAVANSVAVANVSGIGNIATVNLDGSATNVLYGNGVFAGISVGAGSYISNGNSNVNITTANGNITLTAVGNTTMTVTGTGANITGTLNVTDNANVGNLGTSGLIVATGNITGGNLVTAGVLSVTGNANVGNIGTSTAIITTGNITTGNVANLFLTKFQENVASNANTSTSISPNVAASTIFNFTANANFTFNALTSAVAGSSATVIITQDGTGSRLMTSTMLFVGGSKTLSTAASAKDIVSVFYDGTAYFASLTKAYA